MSPRGGSWRDNEIVVFENPLFYSAYQEVIGALADYLLVYFSGHGATVNGERMIKLLDGLAVDQWFVTGHSPRQLMIVDACRTFLHAISGIPGGEEESSSFTGESDARELFDYYILQSPPGKMIVHAARRGEAALETSSLGGVFTYYLLECATYVQTVTAYMPIGILELLGKVRQNLREDGYGQTPVLAWQEGSLMVPIMISVPQIIIGGVEQRRERPPLKRKESLLLGVAVAVGLDHLFKNAS